MKKISETSPLVPRTNETGQAVSPKDQAKNTDSGATKATRSRILAEAPSLETIPSLPLRICEILRQEIGTNLHPGDRLPAMRLLRQRFSVSINTIGAALDMLAREGLIEKRHGSGVYVTEHGGRWRIGILSELDLLDPRIGPYFRLVAGEVKRHLTALGAGPLLYIGNLEPGRSGVSDEPTSPQFWSDATEGRLDGGLILNVPATKRWWSRINNCPIPLVGAFTALSTSLDLVGMVNAAVAHLAGLGCRRLGFMAQGFGEVFHRAIREHELTTTAEWTCTQLDPAVRGSGSRAFQSLWSNQRENPDGLIILDDMLFTDAQLVMLELGLKVPDDLQLAVLSTEGAYPASSYPFTALSVDPKEEAAALSSLLLQQLGGEKTSPVVQKLPFRIVQVEVEADKGPDRVISGRGRAPAATNAGITCG